MCPFGDDVSVVVVEEEEVVADREFKYRTDGLTNPVLLGGGNENAAVVATNSDPNAVNKNSDVTA